jgi:predicted anti-sigma-YlaC factor YlaD
MGQVTSTDCERMRGYVSASIDGELSEVERAQLEAHVGSCAECQAYAADAAAASRILRQTPLEELQFPIQLPSRRLAVARRLQVAAAAAALAVTVGLSAMIGSVGSSQAPAPNAPAVATQAAKLRFPEQELRMLHQASAIRSRLAVHSRLAL